MKINWSKTWSLISDLWSLISDLWSLTSDLWPLISDLWSVIFNLMEDLFWLWSWRSLWKKKIHENLFVDDKTIINYTFFGWEHKHFKEVLTFGFITITSIILSGSKLGGKFNQKSLQRRILWCMSQNFHIILSIKTYKKN